MKLYLVYRVRKDGTRIPEAVMPLADSDLANAGKLYDALVRDDNPDVARKDGEAWEFVAEAEAPRADWERIVPPDAKARPQAISETVDDSDLLSGQAATFFKHKDGDTPG